jgi:hypothetical protein
MYYTILYYNILYYITLYYTTLYYNILYRVFPKVAERLHTKINLTQNFTTVVTGHGDLKSYLHRFKIIDAPNCPGGNGNQTTEHTLLECEILQEDRESLIAAVAKTDN